MKRVVDHPRIVVVIGDSDAGTAAVGRASELWSAQKSGSEFKSAQKSGLDVRAKHAEILRRIDGPPIYDPMSVHREFPDRWRAYIRSNYRDLAHVQQVFGVSERAARKWWNGETGANGAHVAIAVNEHPVAAPRMLFAA